MKKNELTLKQGESYDIVGELKDDNNNVLLLSEYDKIRILIQSPGAIKIVLDENDFEIADNKLKFKLTPLQTAKMNRYAKVEAELIKGTSTVVGLADSDLAIKTTLISKI